MNTLEPRQDEQEICPELEEMQELQESRDAFNHLNSEKPEEKPESKQPKATLKRTGEVDYLDKRKSDKLLSTVTNVKHKTAILLMMDCGLRATECVTLKMENFDFKKKVVLIRSLKKRGHELVREIPISTRLLETLAEYLTTYKAEKDDYLFPNPSNKNEHVSRKSLNRLCERLKENNPSFSELHPHALRHTFATQLLANGAELHNVKTLLGHQSFNTTLIYNHTPIEILRKNIEDMSTVKRSWLSRLMHKYFGKRKNPSLLNFGTAGNSFIVGRDKELMQVVDCLNKNINTILTGKIGIGKSHLLKQIELQGKKILKLDEMANLKLTFVNMLLYLFQNDKEAIKQVLYSDFDNNKLQQKLQRDSVQNLIEEVLKITGKHEYVLMIDNVDGITPRAMKAIEQLKDHFVIITTAREIPINRTSFIWNFEHIRIEPLSRSCSLELIHKLSYDIEVEDMELYRNHIYEQSSGNPRVIFELCERYRKESIVTDDVVRQIRHIGGLPEIDMSFIVILILAGVSILRYTSKEFGGESLRFIGGIALVLLMLSRYFLARTRRKLL
jgi:site-specific recombinase XerD